MQPEIKQRRRTAIKAWIADPIIDLWAYSDSEEDKAYLERWERFYHRWHQRNVDESHLASAKVMGISLEEYREQARLKRQALMAMRHAEKTLLHYFELAIPNLDHDCREEIRGIVMAIQDSARLICKADAITKAGKARKNQPFI